MRLLICAGGTGGGVYPALSILQAMLKMNEMSGNYQGDDPSIEVLWVGSEGGMETEIVSRHNVAYEAISAAGVHGVSALQLPHHLLRLGKGFLQARRILAKFKPDVLFFTGGYLAVPLAFASMLTLGEYKNPKRIVFIPDIEPGLALKTLIKTADCIAISTEESIQYLPKGKNILFSGYPVREEFFTVKENARQHFGLKDDLPLLLIYGGSLGARSINKASFGILKDLLSEMQIIHVTGKLDWEEVNAIKEQLAKVTPHLTERYKPYDYLHDDMALALQAADLVVCRSGASVLGELPAVGVAAILVPYPYAWRYQVTNASYLVKRGAAIMVKDEELPEKLLPTILQCIRNKNQLSQMQSAMKNLAKPEAARMIVEKIYLLGADQRKI